MKLSTAPLTLHITYNPPHADNISRGNPNAFASAGPLRRADLLVPDRPHLLARKLLPALLRDQLVVLRLTLADVRAPGVGIPHRPEAQMGVSGATDLSDFAPFLPPVLVWVFSAF